MDGVVVVDKPAGMGSTDVVRVLRRLTHQRRVGHTGTLDPDATGVLVVCLGKATRLVRFLQEGRKTYAATMVLGIVTTTQDASGEVVARTSAAHVSEDDLCDALQSLVGDIEQVPPMVSAIKVDGERLYERARRGEEIERDARPVTVDDIVLESFVPGEQATASFLVTCSSGTYVRTLAHDAGAALGTGAHLASLRRLANGAFMVDDAHTLEALDDAAAAGELEGLVLSPLAALRGLPVLEVDADEARAVASGRPLTRHAGDSAVGVVAREDPQRLLAVYGPGAGGLVAEAVFVGPEDLEVGT
jgi:tRNA pseudouridine55 synthase